MRIIKQITDNPFLNIKEIHDNEKHCRGYQFAERKGKDSVAFIIFDSKRKDEFMLNSEYTPPTDEYLVRAFGGSNDKNKSLASIVIEEVKEEAGYDVNEKMVHSLGSIFVSTQMNQRCYLYIVDVTKAKNSGRNPENKMEATATTIWMNEEEITMKTEDWKSVCIIRRARYKGII